MRFKIGQEVVCVRDADWTNSTTRQKVVGPKYNEVVTVAGYASNLPNSIALDEYNITTDIGRYVYEEHAFEPLVSHDKLMADLKVKELELTT